MTDVQLFLGLLFITSAWTVLIVVVIITAINDKCGR